MDKSKNTMSMQLCNEIIYKKAGMAFTFDPTNKEFKNQGSP